jgi:hypothetical protein
LVNNGIGVLMKLDKTTHFSEQKRTYSKKTAVKWKSIANRDNGTRFAIEEDSEGNIWFGDRDTGAWKYDGKSVTNYTINNKLSTQMIWSMYKDNNNNLLWNGGRWSLYFNGKSFDKIF